MSKLHFPIGTEHMTENGNLIFLPNRLNQYMEPVSDRGIEKTMLKVEKNRKTGSDKRG